MSVFVADSLVQPYAAWLLPALATVAAMADGRLGRDDCPCLLLHSLGARVVHRKAQKSGFRLDRLAVRPVHHGMRHDACSGRMDDMACGLLAADGWSRRLPPLVSIVAAVLLWPLVPKLLALPTPTEMRKVNTALSRQILETRHGHEGSSRQRGAFSRSVQSYPGAAGVGRRIRHADRCQRCLDLRCWAFHAPGPYAGHHDQPAHDAQIGGAPCKG